jgi:hypothetical protein
MSKGFPLLNQDQICIDLMAKILFINYPKHNTHYGFLPLYKRFSLMGGVDVNTMKRGAVLLFIQDKKVNLY